MPYFHRLAACSAPVLASQDCLRQPFGTWPGLAWTGNAIILNCFPEMLAIAKPSASFLLAVGTSLFARPFGSLRLANYRKCYRLRKCPPGTATGWLFRRLFCLHRLASSPCSSPPPLVGPCALRAHVPPAMRGLRECLLRKPAHRKCPPVASLGHFLRPVAFPF